MTVRWRPIAAGPELPAVASPSELSPAAFRLPTPAPGPISLGVGRLTRTYRIYRPAGLSTDRSVPAVMVLHGGFGSGEQAERSYRWNAKADSEGFLVCYPDGLMRAWNAGACCGEPMRRHVDDVGFLAAVLDRLEAEEAVDPDRVYVAGMSNGAMMAYRLAVELPGRLAAIGPVAGTMTVEAIAAHPVSVCHVHGADDVHVPFLGGRGARAAGRDWRRPVPEVMAEWRSIDRCGPVRAWEDGPVRIETAEGVAGTEVALVVVSGAGHQWPGSVEPHPRVQRALRLDAPSGALDATSLLWSFFTAHPRRA